MAHAATILDISINAGFPFADVHFVGPTVLVTFIESASTEDQGSEAGLRVATAAAVEVATAVWEDRHHSSNVLLSPSQVGAKAFGYESTALRDEKGRNVETGGSNHCTKKSLLIADYADNPGGGG